MKKLGMVCVHTSTIVVLKASIVARLPHQKPFISYRVHLNGVWSSTVQLKNYRFLTRTSPEIVRDMNNDFCTCTCYLLLEYPLSAHAFSSTFEVPRCYCFKTIDFKVRILNEIETKESSISNMITKKLNMRLTNTFISIISRLVDNMRYRPVFTNGGSRNNKR